MVQVRGNTPNGQGATIPVPVGGWNTKSPIDQMRDIFAVRMDNLFPETSTIRLRKGSRAHTTGGMGGASVQTLAEFVHEDGTRRLIGCANGNIYNCTTYNVNATSLASGFTQNRWQTVNFRNRLVLVNGVDQPKQYDGSTVSDATYTGISNDNKLVQVINYKSRLYFAELDSASIWYGDVDAVTGALTELDVSSLLRLGGRVEFVATYSRSAGEASGDDLLAIVSNMGEVLIYAGDNPEASNWGIVGRYEIAPPLGRRAYLQINADVRIVTEKGIYSLSSAIGRDNSPRVTDLVEDAWSDAVASYSSNSGWDCLNYKFGHMAIFNVPTATNSSAVQFVVNTMSGAWCCFKGISAISWTTYNKKPYFGGPDGKIYEFDVGYNDNGVPIDAELKCSFNFMGDKQRNKHFTMVRPVVNGDANLMFKMGVDVDFEDKPLTDTVTIVGAGGSKWDAVKWDTAKWGASNIHHTNWYGVTGFGRSAAIKLKGSFKDAPFSISAFNMIYQTGGVF